MLVEINQSNSFQTIITSQEVSVIRIINSRAYKLDSKINSAEEALKRLSNILAMSDTDFVLFATINKNSKEE